MEHRHRAPAEDTSAKDTPATPANRDLPLKSPSGQGSGGSNWTNLRRDRPANKGHGVPGQRRG